MEPGNPGCWDQDTDMELPIEGDNPREGWCNDFFCYVDACQCDAEIFKSSYFGDGESVSYSYQTCGFGNAYVAGLAGGGAAAECTDPPGDSGSIHNFVSYPVGLVVVSLMGRSLRRA